MSRSQLEDERIIREDEFRRCRRSFAYFFEHYWTVIYEYEMCRPEVREAQMEAAALFQTEKRLIIVKARQIGWTTLCSAYMFWLAYFHPNRACLAISKREDPEARDIIYKIGLGYDFLPRWFRLMGPKVTHRTLSKMQFTNNSFMDSDASSDDPGRGRTLAFLLADEFGKLPNPESAWQSALPATEHGQCFVIGNANGFGTFFHTQYLMAKAGQSDFKPLFFSWRAGGAERDEEWLAKATSSYTPAQRAAEYPEDDEECWILAGSPRFDPEYLKELPRQSGLKCSLLGERLVPDADGPVEVYQPAQLGRRYVVGADTAAGGTNSDYSCAQVLDVLTGQHVAEFHLRCDVDHYAMELVKLARHYNDALIAPERNNEYGVALIDNLLAQGYRNIYRERKWGYKAGQAGGTRYGFQTTRDTKAMGLELMWSQLRSGAMQSTSPEYLQEMIEYQFLANGECAGSKNDDRVMAMVMACVGRRTVYLPGEKLEPEPVDEMKDRVTAEGAVMPVTFKEYIEAPVGRTRQSVATRPTSRRFTYAPQAAGRQPTSSRRYQ